jgi:hypothetical protein
MARSRIWPSRHTRDLSFVPLRPVDFLFEFVAFLCGLSSAHRRPFLSGWVCVCLFLVPPAGYFTFQTCRRVPFDGSKLVVATIMSIASIRIHLIFLLLSRFVFIISSVATPSPDGGLNALIDDDARITNAKAFHGRCVATLDEI